MPESPFNKVTDLLPEIQENFAKVFSKIVFLQDIFWRLLLIFRKLDIPTFNSKQICSLDQYCWHNIFDE